MTASQLFVVRRCDRFYRYWHDVIDPAPMHEAYAVYDQLTGSGAHSTTPDDAEYYDVFQINPLPGWRDGPQPLIRRLHPHDARAIEAHMLGLTIADRRLRFFREASDAQMLTYVRSIDWERSLLLGAVHTDRIVGLAEALFDRSAPPRHAEIAVSVDPEFRGRGLGRHLVGSAVDRAKLSGTQHAHLIFQWENQPLQGIIRALGGLIGQKNLADGNELIGVIRTDRSVVPTLIGGLSAL